MPELISTPLANSKLSSSYGQVTVVSVEVIALMSKVSYLTPLWSGYSRLVELIKPVSIVSSASMQGSMRMTEKSKTPADV